MARLPTGPRLPGSQPPQDARPAPTAPSLRPVPPEWSLSSSPLRLQGQLQGEGRSLILPRARARESAAQLRGHQGADVQTEAVPPLLGGEALGEDAPQVLRWNPHPIVY